MSKSTADQNELRKRAEAHRRARHSAPKATQQPDDLLHELEVHQIELEMQNEELQNAQARLVLSLARYQALFDLAPVGYLSLRLNGVIVDANLTVARLLKIDRNQLAHTKLSRYVSCEHQDTLLRHLRTTFRGNDHQTCELELIRGDDVLFVAQLESVVQYTGGEQQAQCLTVVTDITERRRQEALIHRQANYDALTDLPNRALFLDRLAYTIRTAQRERTSLALFYIDVDNFKWINDTYGHAAGDRVLVETARRFTGCARENDTVARLSGDEFCILLPKVSSTSSASLVASKVLASMEAPFTLPGGHNLRVSCSIGIALYPKDCDNADTLLKNADIALYQVKRCGRGHFALFTKELDEATVQQQRLSSELNSAIPRNELTLRYQPVIELDSGRVIGAEVLARWQHPEHGLLMPKEFIPIAETNGAIVEIGEWVMKQVCEQARAWHEEGAELGTLWVNLSAKQCGNVSRVNRLSTLLETLHDWTGPPRVGLELNERNVLEFSDTMLSTFESLYQRGVPLSVDHFGSEYSSLGRLQQLPLEHIKVNKAFVAGLATAAKSVNLLKAVIAFSHAMQIRVVAEGIETQQQIEMLQELGCDFGQGFYIAAPLTHEGLDEFLRTH